MALRNFIFKIAKTEEQKQQEHKNLTNENIEKTTVCPQITTKNKF